MTKDQIMAAWLLETAVTGHCPIMDEALHAGVGCYPANVEIDMRCVECRYGYDEAEDTCFKIARRRYGRKSD